MLRKYLILFFSLSVAVETYGQTSHPKNEVAISGGYISGTEVIGSSFAAGTYEDGEYFRTRHTGTLFASYRGLVSKGVLVGLTVGVQSLAYNYQNLGMKYSYPDYSTKMTLTTLAFETKLIYTKPGSLVQLYALIGLGTTFFYEVRTPDVDMQTRQPIFFNSQWTPLAVRIGRRLGGFAEFGIGYKGAVNCGLSYRL